MVLWELWSWMAKQGGGEAKSPGVETLVWVF